MDQIGKGYVTEQSGKSGIITFLMQKEEEDDKRKKEYICLHANYLL